MCGHGQHFSIDISSPINDNSLGKLVFHGYDQIPGTVTVLHDEHTSGWIYDDDNNSDDDGAGADNITLMMILWK